MAESTKHRLAFEAYYRLGADRSIEKLREALAAEGKAPSLRTLYEWSSKYAWQDRLRDVEREARQAEREARIAEAREAIQRQKKLGLLLQQKGAEWIAALGDKRVTPAAAVRAVVEGVALERSAGGMGTGGGRGGEVVTEVRELVLHLGGPDELYMFPDPDQEGDEEHDASLDEAPAPPVEELPAHLVSEEETP